MSYKGKGCFSAILDGSIPIALVKHGLETVFSKTEEPVEPSPIAGYTVLDYIYGYGSQYAIIDYYANQNTKIEMKFEYTKNATNTSNLFAGRTTYDKNAFSFLPDEGGKSYSRFGSDVKEIALISQNETHTIIKDGIYTYIDGELKATHPTSTFTAGGKMYILFQSSSSATPLQAKIYYMKIWDNGTMLYDLVPVKNNETGVVGLYNLISGEFITSATTTNFVEPVITGNDKYVTENLYANYRGIDFISPTKWLDTVNGNNITMLQNPTYNSENHSWKFNSSSKQYGKATLKAPAGDYTIEIYGEFPAMSSTTKIVAMFGGTWANTVGYGLMSTYLSTSAKVNAFIIPPNSSTSQNTIADIGELLTSNIKTKWVARRNKETGELSVYAKNINGEKTYTETKTTASLTSSPASQFSIGTQKVASSNTSDYCTCSYYAVRLYDRYLTDEEIAQNHAEDVRIYGE